MPKRKKTTDGIEIMHRRYFEGRPEMLAMLERFGLAATDVDSIIRLVRSQLAVSVREIT